jgi:hypothetical protein
VRSRPVCSRSKGAAAGRAAVRCRPARRGRPAEASGWWGALSDGLTPLPIAYRDRSPASARALAGNVDLSGDGVPDLVVSAPGASRSTATGTGAVFVFSGGPGMGGKLDPFLTVVGDGSERASVGQD